MTPDPNRRRRFLTAYGLSLLIHALFLMALVLLAIDWSGTAMESSSPADFTIVQAEATVAPTPVPTVAPPPVRAAVPPTPPPLAHELSRNVRNAPPQPKPAKTFVPTPPPIVPTAAPTAAPTAIALVTPQPTIVPTIVPTVAPTVAPTIAPTAKPTPVPTVAPTQPPTAAPTVRPTLAPTPRPTVAPTAAPTVAPTAARTARPTIAPTAAPTRIAAVATAAPAPTGAPGTPRPAGTPGTGDHPGGKTGHAAGHAASGTPGTSSGIAGPSAPPVAPPGGPGSPLYNLNARLRSLNSPRGTVDYTPQHVNTADLSGRVDAVKEAYERRLAPPPEILAKTFGLIFAKRTSFAPDSVTYVFERHGEGLFSVCRGYRIIEHPYAPPERRTSDAIPDRGAIGRSGANVADLPGPPPDVKPDIEFITIIPCKDDSYKHVPLGSITTPVPRHPDLEPSPRPSLAPGR